MLTLRNNSPRQHSIMKLFLWLFFSASISGCDFIASLKETKLQSITNPIRMIIDNKQVTVIGFDLCPKGIWKHGEQVGCILLNKPTKLVQINFPDGPKKEIWNITNSNIGVTITRPNGDLVLSVAAP